MKRDYGKDKWELGKSEQKSHKVAGKTSTRLVRLFTLAFITCMILLTNFQGASAWTSPALDGVLDDVYRLYGSKTRYTEASVHGPTGLDHHPAATMYVLEDEKYIYVYYQQDILFTDDSSYGENSIHWEVSPNGQRSFEEILDGDKGEFIFKDADGGIAAHFYVDQISPSEGTPSGYDNVGFSGRDGEWIDGYSDRAYISSSSSMGYNLNTTGYCSDGSCTCGSSGIDLLITSPEATGEFEVVDPGCSDWIWYSGWEIRVSKEAFGEAGFGEVLPNHHSSPTKSCQDVDSCRSALNIASQAIGDRVWHDLNGDGVQDSEEPGLSGVTVYLIDPRLGTIIESQTTDDSGTYLFTELSNMYYIVQVDESSVPSGLLSMTQEMGDFHEAYVNNVCGDDCIQRDGETYTHAYYLKVGQKSDHTDVDFGYGIDGATIGNTIWSDVDGDGEQDPEERGIKGVLLELLDGNGALVGVTATTDDAGRYKFSGLEAGKYMVNVAASNFEAGGILEGQSISIGPESNITPTNVISLVAGQDYEYADFGYRVIPNLQPAAASNNNGQWFMQWGAAAPTSYGAYISSSSGLNTYYSYFIEVPTGVSSLVVDLFDADVGNGGTGNELSLNLDRPVGWGGGAWNTSCTYTLYNPTGGTAATATGNAAGPAGSHNAWWNMHTAASPANGHWELRVRCGTGNDVNTYGIRAHDGNSGAGGTELNVYAHSFVPLGTNDTDYNRNSGDNRVNEFYPFVTSGCVFDSNDFDFDSARTGSTYNSSIVATSRTSAFSQTIPEPSLSNDDVWANNPISGWTSDPTQIEYGIWHMQTRIYELTVWGYTGNYIVFYAGEFNATNPPPTSQPEPNTFRLYLPTDGGTAPAKPIVSQSLAHISGPNPPALGSTTRVVVSIDISNPAAQAITFSASNLVTANIPGSGALYAGNASVTQGSITGQPSIGGTGNITWNPGTIAAGGSAQLQYHVDVTPTSSGQRIAVTGTPATNGTTAVYVDETGNSSQANATYSYGPLCELAVTENGNPIPTLAVISHFDVLADGNKAVVNWETSSEVRTAGFNLYRRDESTGKFEKINHKLLIALLHAPQGGRYSFVDEGASVGKTYTYEIVEVEFDGTEIVHGPFTVEINGKVDGSFTSSEPYRKIAHEVGTASNATTQVRRGGVASASSHTSIPSDPSPPAASGEFKIFFPTVTKRKHAQELPVGKPAKITVTQDGLYYLSAQDIANAMDLTTAEVEDLIHDYQLQVVNQGQQIAYLRHNIHDGIYFYGEKIDNLYTTENVYWLIQGLGNALDSLDGRGPDHQQEGASFAETVHLEQDKYALTGLFDDPNADYWLWDLYIAGDPSYSNHSYTFNTPGATMDGAARLDIYLKGATNAPSERDHHLIIRMKVGDQSHQIGEARWDGSSVYHFHTTFDPARLVDGENTLELVAVLDDGVPYSIFYLDSFTITYDQYLHASDDRLDFTSLDASVVTVHGFTDPNISVLDITTPDAPILISATTIRSDGGTYNVSFAPGNGERRYLAVSRNGLSSYDALVKDISTNLKSNENRANYLIITDKLLQESAQPLSAYRQSQGYISKVVLLEEIYDEFSYGIADPNAIKDFLKFAFENWATPPSNVVLFGTGTYDYKDNLGFGDNHVPTMMVSAFGGLYASDTYFADVQKNDGVPEFALGRLPVGTAAEASAVISKIKGFETVNKNAWSQNVIMLADNPDLGGNFTADSDRLAEMIPQGYDVEKIYLSEMEVEEARQALMASMNGGVGLINYLGHGGLDRLAQEGLLLSDDAAALNNPPEYSILTAMTCVAGRFEIPGHSVIGETLLLDSNGGSVGIWAPSGPSYNDAATLYDSFLFKAIFEDSESTLGEALVAAAKQYAGGNHSREILAIYNLLGDPALALGWN